MRRSRLSRSVVSTFLLVTAMTLLLIWSGGNQASAVETVGGSQAGVDSTSSLGRFAIKLVPMFGGEIVESPLLYDSGTTIGRSDPFNHGDATDTTNGAPICGTEDEVGCKTWLAGVADGDFAVVPPLDDNLFEGGPADTDEVHTQILRLEMVAQGCGDTAVPAAVACGSATAVRAGNSAPDAPRSIGEVESLPPPPPQGGVGEGTFPAESFFNVFVEVDIDVGDNGTIDITVFNKEPLLIESGDLDGFPPKVVYRHGNTNAVQVFHKAIPALLVGHLIVAGHGIGFNFGDTAEFNAVYEELEQNPMPISAVGGTVELLGQSDSPADASESSSARDYTAPVVAAVAAGALALAAGGWYARRRWLR